MSNDNPNQSPENATTPSSEEQTSGAISPKTFYGTNPSPKPPALPARPRPGSSLTKTSYVPDTNPSAPPPDYGATDTIPISAVPQESDETTQLIPDDGWHVSTQSQWDNNGWGTGTDWAENTEAWYSSLVTSSDKVCISNRNKEEEKNWWDRSTVDKAARPGPGFTPPLLSDRLHEGDHTLFSVSASQPDISIPPASSSQDSPARPPGLHSTQWTPPSDEEVRMAVPHPNAYYCRAENSWVLLIWQTSTVLPSFTREFHNSSHPPLPNEFVRNSQVSCIDPPEKKKDLTHHFHLYERAVDSSQLFVPYVPDEWQKPKKSGDDMDVAESTQGELLDIYICCQCQVYCLASRTLPGVISKQDLNTFINDRSQPPVGRTSEESIVDAFGTLMKAMQNNLWRGESRRLRVTRPKFVASMGSHPVVGRMLATLGFERSDLEDGEEAWKLPDTDPKTALGKFNRRRLLRAWVELGAWVTEFKYKHRRKPGIVNLAPTSVKVISIREECQTAVGAHPDQLPRGGLDDKFFTLNPADFDRLGLSPMIYTPELLAYCYFAQCRCDPSGTLEYFTSLFTIVEAMMPTVPQDLQSIIFEERERLRFTASDLAEAIKSLGFGPNESLRIEYDTDVSDDFVENAWKEAIKRAWHDPTKSTELQKAANDALRMVAESRGSAALRNLWNTSSQLVLTPDKAFSALEVPMDVDESMLIMVYEMRLQESPYQKDRYREALTVIAEYRDSERLKKYTETGIDPGEGFTTVSPYLPRGLNQLGNTCYLNSILQYFYTIRDLRETVVQLNSVNHKGLPEAPVTDADLKKHRVGGRLVTQHEVVRSRKFVSQLADLFFNLEYCEQPAVTPTIELAKLALVTSRDEQEDSEKGGTETSNDTDATLVEDEQAAQRTVSPVPQVTSPVRSPGSILGKRGRELEKELSAMEVDQPLESEQTTPTNQSINTGDPVILSPIPRRAEQGLAGPAQVSISKDDDVSMGDSPPPLETPEPLPKPQATKKSTTFADSGMMFGKQHDVAECLDNCMFQIETALLDFNGDDSAPSSEKTSIVKRLFYGKIRQRLSPIEGELKQGSVHEKEDLFSHLPVNVAEDGVDIYDGLSGYFDDVVDFQGSKARMEVSLVDLPPLLQIQLQRVQFNRETLQPYKSQAYVKFGETIHVDRFLSSADPKKKGISKRLNQDLLACREHARCLQTGKDVPFSPALKRTAQYLSQLENIPGIDENLAEAVNQEGEAIEAEISNLQQRAKALKTELEELWQTDEPQATYELTSVFIHRGSSPTFGHYFFYSRDLPDNPDSWFKYNDSQVTPVSKDEVLADTTGSTANPYLLVFARKGSEVVHTVNRFDASNLEQSQEAMAS